MSNQVISGVVDRTWTKQKSTRFGEKQLHYCSVDGVEFSTGFKKVFTDGEMINAVVKFNYGELQYQPNETADPSLPKAQAGAPVSKGNFPSKGGSYYGAKGKFPVDPKDGQMSIIRQSSMNRAVEIMEQLMEYQITKPATEEEYLKQLFEIALNITDFSSGNDIMQLKAAQQAQLEANNG